MKKIKFDSVVSLSRHRCLQFVMGFALVYCCFMTSQIPFLSRSLSPENHNQETQIRFSNPNQPQNPRILSNLVFKEDISGYSSIYRSAVQAWEVGSKLWEAVVLTTAQQKQNLNSETHKPEEQTTSCPHSITLSGDRFYRLNRTLALPCGMMLGSHVTVVGKPRAVHLDSVSVMSGGGRLTKKVNVSQFMFELRKGNDQVGEEPPRILHFNPRIEGDWSGRPVIEMNACYRGQWGTALRCEGWRTTPDEETVDGQVRCEEWVRDYDDDKHSKELRSSWWSNRLARGTKEVATIEWSFPFAENKYFVLTVSAGLEGFHVSVDGRHVASFPYRTGFELEDSANAYLYGDIDVHSVYAASLPTSHPSFVPHRRLEMSAEWQAPPVPDGPVDLFIGILSAADHFTERMAVRKSWMQHYLVRSSRVVPRFFVALHRREMINVELKKEAEFFGDIIIVPYLDNYDLVVLKTAAICEYGVNAVAANYILKCDDDTFVRLDAVIQVAEKAGGGGQSFYLGKMNYYHRPLRVGKWAVGFEEWPEKLYPPYADGPGYIISADIARFVVSELERNSLRLFKMEDVSMGMWVEQFNKIIPVDYIHDALFVQHGCVDGYYTAHYQSPKQMICLWDRLQNEGLAKCCNLR